MSTHTRTTKEVVTPAGRKVVINDYLTTSELRKIQAVLVDGVSAGDLSTGSQSDQAIAMDKVPAKSIFKAQELALEFLVVSVDGDTNEPYKQVMDLPPEETKELLDEALEHLSGIAKKKAD